LTSPARPAFYALSPGGWRDYVTLLHPPYTLWHLSYVVIGASLAPDLRYWRLALAWGGFPLLTGYFAVAERIRPEAVVAAVFATLLSLAQRLLSTQVRTVRRRTRSVSGTIVYGDGREERLDAESLTRAPEAALKALAAATVCLAVALVVLHRP